MFVRMNKNYFLGFSMILFLNLFATESLAKKNYSISIDNQRTIKVKCNEVMKIGDKITDKISKKIDNLPPNQIKKIAFKDCNVYHGRYEKMKNQFGGNIKIIVESDHTWDFKFETSSFIKFGRYTGLSPLYTEKYLGYKWN